MLFKNLFAKSEPEETAPPSPPGPKRFKRMATLPPDPENPDCYEVVCPYCLSKCHAWELLFRAEFTEDLAEDGHCFDQEEDIGYAEFWENRKKPREEMQKKILNPYDRQQAGTDVVAVRPWDSTEFVDWDPSTAEQYLRQKKPIAQIKDKFGWISSERICPNPTCHNVLPDQIGRIPNYIFSFMGNTNSGKTVYMYRLINNFFNMQVFPGRVYTVSSRGEKQEVTSQFSNKKVTRGQNEVAAQLFKPNKNGAPISDTTPVGYINPIMLEIVEESGRSWMITLFDFPGEAIWGGDDAADTFRLLMQKNVENTHGWIFCMDATAFDPVKMAILESEEFSLLPTGTVPEDLEDDDSQTFKGMDIVLSTFLDRFIPGGTLNKPVAFVIAKADLLKYFADALTAQDIPLPPNGRSFLDPAPNPKRPIADLDEILLTNQNVQKMLSADLSGRTAATTARIRCPLSSWFAVSATGVALKDGTVTQLTYGIRSEQPMEWLMWMCGIVDGRAKEPECQNYISAISGVEEVTG